MNYRKRQKKTRISILMYVPRATEKKRSHSISFSLFSLFASLFPSLSVYTPSVSPSVCLNINSLPSRAASFSPCSLPLDNKCKEKAEEKEQRCSLNMTQKDLFVFALIENTVEIVLLDNLLYCYML